MTVDVIDSTSTFPTNASEAFPDFSGLDAAAIGTSDKRTFVLALIGNLSFAWSNNESLFIHLIRALTGTDEASSVIIFSTLGSARARIELVSRLGRAHLGDASLLAELETTIESFDACTRVRNEFNHCMYAVGEDGSLSHTQSFRIRDVDGAPKLERPKPIDASREAHIIATIEELKRINRCLWALLPRLEAHVAAPSATR